MKVPQLFPVTCHTDHVGQGSTFVAINGFNMNGAAFIPHAITKGATTIVIDEQQEVDIASIPSHVKLLRVNNTRKALAELCAQAAGNPAQHLKLIGITGTKGKTTTAFILFHILKSAGLKAALMSTAGNAIGDHKFSPSLTTPQPDYLHQFLKLCLQEGVTHVVMEVAAQAITMHRVDGLLFDSVAFTNFGLEHLEFYDSMDSYFAAKKGLLDLRKPHALAWINNDDERVRLLKDNNIKTFALNNTADLGQDRIAHIQCPALMGTYNKYNILAAIGMAQSLGIDAATIDHAIATFSGIPGRMERYAMPNGATMIIDYAHNPLSYEALLSYLRTQTDHLLVLFGAGGQRDASRRPLMGAVASKYADMLILTSDNPRNEDPIQIIQDIKKGINTRVKILQELDREQAIKAAYSHTKPGSIVVLLGKGPDEYQIVGPQKSFFSERIIIQSMQ